MILISKYIIAKGYLGMALFPFIFLRSKKLIKYKILINHEKIHLRQQLELLVLPFYIIYMIEFCIKLFRHGDWKRAYALISFEKEAYANESNLKFLQKRPFWNFMRYF